MDVSIDIAQDTATNGLNELIRKVNPELLARACLSPLKNHWAHHLAALPSNKRGFPSTGFWEGCARSVLAESTVEGGAVVLRGSGPPGRPGLSQRYHGGTIYAKNHANITIPIAPEAYGTTVADWGFENLTFVMFASGHKFLALATRTGEAAPAIKLTKRAETTTRKVQKLRSTLSEMEHPRAIFFKEPSSASTLKRMERTWDLKLLFMLEPSTYQMANPDVIPSDIADVAMDAVRGALFLK